MKNAYRIEQSADGNFHLFLVRGDGWEVWLAKRPTKKELAALLGGR